MPIFAAPLEALSAFDTASLFCVDNVVQLTLFDSVHRLWNTLLLDFPIRSRSSLCTPANTLDRGQSRWALWEKEWGQCWIHAGCHGRGRDGGDDSTIGAIDICAVSKMLARHASGQRENRSLTKRTDICPTFQLSRYS